MTSKDMVKIIADVIELELSGQYGRKDAERFAEEAVAEIENQASRESIKLIGVGRNK